MDFEAIVDKECPAPIHWLTHRRYVIGRVKYEVEKRDARIAELEATIAHLRNVASEQHAWEEMADRCGLQLKPEAAEKNVKELREAVRVLAVAIAPLVGATDGDDICLTWDGAQNVRNAMANPIAAEAVREAAK